MNFTLPNWIERLLGIPVESGEGTTCGLDFVWYWPPWATLLLIAMVVFYVAAIYRRERSEKVRSHSIAPAVLRILSLGIVLLMIAQMTLSLQRTGLPYVALILDDSQSMSTADSYSEKMQKNLKKRLEKAGMKDASLSRWNIAATFATEDRAALLRNLAGAYKLRVYFLTGPRPVQKHDVPGIVEEIVSAAPTGPQTRLGGGVRSVLDDLRGAAPAAIVLLTDGINTAGPSLAEAADYAHRRGVPLFFVGLGSRRPVRDLKLTDLLVDDVVFIDDVVSFQCKLAASGFEGEKVTVVLREKDNPEPLAKTEVALESDEETREVRLSYRPTREGQFDFVVEAEPLEGEIQTENNRQSRTVQVRKEKIRVLMTQAYPSFEFRYLRNLLGRDETIALSTVLQEADVEHAEQDATALRAFPLRRDELFAYDVVIFGDVDPAMLAASSLQNLADFVDQPAKGGALVLIAGPSFMPSAYRESPLARLFPFPADSPRYPDPSRTITEPFVVQPTEIGLASPSMQLGDTPQQTEEIWSRLAPLRWLLELPELRPGVRILAEHPTRVDPDGRRLPVFCLQYVGAGKVLFHATDETWRWRYRAGDEYFARYWIQTIRYLCRTKLSDGGRPVLLTADRPDYVQGESVRLRARFADERLAPAADDGVTVAIEQSGHPPRRVALHRFDAGRGAFEAVLDRLAPGEYHALMVEPAIQGQVPAADFRVNPPANEFAQLRMDAAEMRRAAEQTGGRFYTVESVDRLLHSLPPGHQVPIESLPPIPLWNRWPVLALFLALLIAEWILRKRQGLI